MSEGGGRPPGRVGQSTRRVTLVPGDGTGPELTAAVRRIVEASGAAIEWEVQTIRGEDAGDGLPPALLDSIRRNGVALKGPVTTSTTAGARSANTELRRALDLFAQVRICRSFPGVEAPFGPVDVVVIRETTEDLYAGVEFDAGSPEARSLIEWLAARTRHRLSAASAVSLKPISAAASRRIFEFAFDYARRQGRRKVTAVHKATVMPATDGVFLAAAREVAREHPDIELDDWTVDSLALQLVRRPREFDVLVAPNLYGDVLGNLCAALVGGVGLVPGGNFGEGAAVFEAAHGSAPRYAGRNRVNPMALTLSAAMMLRYLGREDAAARIEATVAAVIADGRCVTYDLKADRDDPTAVGTSDVADTIVEGLQDRSALAG